MEGKQVNLSILPSRGKLYPDDIEIFVKPMTAREEMSTSLSRFGSTKSSYYETLLDNIIINGNFSKSKLLFGDIQFIDLIRRLFTFELEEKIHLKDVKCDNCDEDLEITFMFSNNGECENKVQFEDYREEVFNKCYIFSDNTKIIASPLTIGSFISISKKYLSNIKDPEDMTEYLFAYRAALVNSIEGRLFENEKSMLTFVKDYFSNLYKYKDTQLLSELDKDMSVLVKPFSITCKKCGHITEVGIEPSMRFHQE